MPSLYEASARPRVIINTNEIPSDDGNNVVMPAPKEADESAVKTIFDKLLGINGQERYQLWPEKVVREGLSAAHDVMTEGALPPGLRREDYTDTPAPSSPNDDSTLLGKMLGVAPVATSPADKLIGQAQAVSALAGTGGLAGVEEGAGAALGSTPFLRPALKYGEKLYKGKEGQQHLDLIPPELYPEFQRQALNGDDISHWNFGFTNDKGHFLDREKALQYGIDNGILNPQDAKFGALTSTLMSDSSKPGAAIQSLKYPLAKPSDRWMNTLGQNDHLIQNMTPDEFLSKSRPLKIDAESRENIDALKQHMQEGKSLDPLELHANGKEDGRHRAIAAKELGIKEVPVINQRPSKPFYSAVENAVAGAKQPTADAQQWLGYLKNQPGVKQEELAHLGLDKLSGPISKEQLLQTVQKGQPQIKEVVKGEIDKNKIAELEQQYREAQKAYDKLDFNNLKLSEVMAQPETKNLNRVREELEAAKVIPTKYHSYQLPGGSNYKEMLLTLPDKTIKQTGPSEWAVAFPEGNVRFNNEKSAMQAANVEAYRSSHWDEPNVLAHIRMNDRNIDGKKTLHLEEIQSDWHQAGRKQGYRDLAKEKEMQAKSDEAMNRAIALNDQMEKLSRDRDPVTNMIRDEKLFHELARQRDAAKAEMNEASKQINQGVPDAPFKKTWDELALKHVINHAVRNGYDKVSWTPGEAQAARYDLSKQVDAIRANKNPDGTYMIGTQKPGHNMSRPTKEMEKVPADKLADVVGKELAEKIIKGEGGKADEYGRVYSGLDLKVGGQGMKAFYDKMLVDKMNALGKKYGAKVSKSDLNSDLINAGNRLRDFESQFGSKPIPADKKAEWNKLRDDVAKAKGVEPNLVHTFPITPELRNQVLTKGFPLFSMGLPVYTPVSHNPFKETQ